MSPSNKSPDMVVVWRTLNSHGISSLSFTVAACPLFSLNYNFYFEIIVDLHTVLRNNTERPHPHAPNGDILERLSPLAQCHNQGIGNISATTGMAYVVLS